MENNAVLDAELLQILTENGYYNITTKPGRGVCAVLRMLYTTGLICGLDEYGYRGRYCYETMSEAIQALFTWDGAGDPPGDWIKYKGEGGEYSNPNYIKE